MQPRLTRSRTDIMVAGICGGLGSYFGVDPVIVRIIFVLVTLTSGLGLPFYLVLWLVMPRDGAPASSTQQQFTQQNAEDLRRGASRLGREMAEIGQQIGQEAVNIGQQISREAREILVAQQATYSQQPANSGQPPTPPDPSSYNFDPLTGQPLRPEGPTTGPTINLRIAPQAPIEQQVQPQLPPGMQQMAAQRGKNWRTLGIVLIGIGALIFLNQISVLEYVFPLVMIIAGLVLLRRR